MAESFVQAGSGLLDLSAVSLADLPHLEDAVVEEAVDRLTRPCGDAYDGTTVIGGGPRMWQNYATER
jgi:hypothetical protein